MDRRGGVGDDGHSVSKSESCVQAEPVTIGCASVELAWTRMFTSQSASLQDLASTAVAPFAGDLGIRVRCVGV